MDTTINYVCGECNRGECKLWRLTHTSPKYQLLTCAKCITQKSNIAIDQDGRCINKYGEHTHQILDLVPAVPTADFSTFWGYTGEPQDRVVWWENLPN